MTAPGARSAALLLAACTGGAAAPDAPVIPAFSVGDVIPVVPGPGFAHPTQPAHNNLDVVEHDGAVFLALRTAPTHFASADTRLVIARSDDGEGTWSVEAEVHLGTDLREPRLLSWQGRLFLYFAVLGDNPADFEPQGSRVMVRAADGTWSAPEDIFDRDFVPWRVRVVGGRPTLTGYTGGGTIYDADTGGDAEPDLEIQWLESDDGLDWRPVVPGQPTILRGGGSETDLAVLPDGGAVAVVRNEDGDADGWGSKICRADAGALGAWRCAADPRKFDSPLVFQSGGRVWLIGRRTLGNEGAYDLGLRSLSHQEQTLRYQIEYWNDPKRCSLWEVHPDALRVDFVGDLPSAGDTCFASALPREDGSFMVYNYTSPLDGRDPSWLDGQLGPTHIVRHRVTLPR
jgi:hypothetical protein